MDSSGLLRFFTLAIIYFGPIVVAYLIYRSIKNYQKAEQIDDAKHNYMILKISVPKNNEKTPFSAEQMFAALHGIYNSAKTKQEEISFEIASVNKSIQFFCYLPIHLKDFVEGQIYSQYPTAEITESSEYLKEVEPGFSIAGAEIKLQKDDPYPIKTFTDFNVDPLAGITGVLSQVDLYDQVAMQVIIRPVDDSWQDKGMKLVKSIKTGTPIGGVPFGQMFKAELKKFPVDLVKSVKSGEKKEEKKEDKKELPGPVDEGVKSIETKIKKLGFETVIRIISICKDEELAKSKISGIVGAFKQFNTINLNGFIAEEADGKELLEKFKLRHAEDGYILNIEELASVYHFPSVTVETPTIVWSGSKKGEPPSNLPLVETTSPELLTVLGKVYYRNASHKFGIKIPDRRLHIYSVGKTGTGKSTLFENMLYDDVKEGRGVAVVDPHGDLVEAVLNFIPDNRIEDVVYFNPADHENTIGFNLLENVDPELQNIVASGVVGIFKKIFGESWGPRLEYILRNVIIALLEYQKASLLDVTRMLVDRGFRSEVVATVKDPVIRDFFIKEYEQYDEKFRTEAIAPIQNKVGQFLSSTTIRNIVGQNKSTINIEDIMNSSKILLVDLSTGKIGEDNSALLGAMMITKIQMSAMRRVYVPKDQRNDFFLYVDEFQNFATDSFATILSEARKYGLGLMVTNQYVAQMPEVVSNAIFGNVGTMISFRVGPGDAETLAKEFAPVFEANDLINLDNYKAYIKMSIDGVTCQAFSAATLPPPGVVYGDNRAIVIRRSIEKFSRSREDIETEINTHLGRQADILPVLTGLPYKKEKTEEEQEIKPVETVIYKIGDQEFKNLKDKKSGSKWFIEKESYDDFEVETKEKQKTIDEKARRERGEDIGENPKSEIRNQKWGTGENQKPEIRNPNRGEDQKSEFRNQNNSWNDKKSIESNTSNIVRHKNDVIPDRKSNAPDLESNSDKKSEKEESVMVPEAGQLEAPKEETPRPVNQGTIKPGETITIKRDYI